MARVIQALAFFGLLGAVFLVAPSLSGGAESLAVLLSGSVVSALVAYVLPWVFFELDTEPLDADPSATRDGG